MATSLLDRHDGLSDFVSEHPFGREHQVSVQKLFRFFCNSLYLGQWGLAKACIAQLHEEAHLLQIDIREILREIAKNPYGYCLGSGSVESPHHLSWLCLQEYQSLNPTSLSQDELNGLQKDVQFRLQLVELGNKATEQNLQELYHYHLNLHAGKSLDDSCFLSTEVQALLCDTLLQDPALGHSLLQALVAPSDTQYAIYNAQIYGLHQSVLANILHEIRKIKPATNNDRPDGSVQSTCDTHQTVDRHDLNSLTERFLSLLSLFNPDVELIEELHIAALFRTICNLVHHSPILHEYLPPDRLYSCIMGGPGERLLRLFCDIEYEVHRKEKEAFLVGGGVSHLQKTTLSNSLMIDRPQAWRDLFLLCQQKQQHFIQLILDTALSLVKRDQLDLLQQLLAPPEFIALCPLVVLMGWEHCADMETARRLLDALITDQVVQDEGDFSPLTAACQELSYHVDLVQWCLDKTREVLAEDSSENGQQRTSLLFQGLGTQSVLYMLHHSQRLPLLRQEEVFAMLQKTPEDASAPQRKSVHFAEANEQRLKPEQERDIAVYRSYCILRCFMQALEFSADSSNWEHYRTPLLRRNSVVSMETSMASLLGRGRSESLERSESDQWDSLMDGFQKRYNEAVMDKLAEAQHQLAQLHPLTYRVEVLEDAFSLLFTTNEHVHDVLPSDSGDECLEESHALSISLTSSPDPASRAGPRTPESPLVTPNPLFSRGTHKKPHVRSLTKDFWDKGSISDTAVHSKPDQPVMRISGGSIFNISKTELKAGGSSDGAKKLSGTNSNSAGGSSGENFQVGFLANEFFVRDLLATLKTCLQDLVAARFSLMGTGSADSAHVCSVSKEQEESLMQSVHSSVEISGLQQRISCLRQHVNEATWRFELVAPEWLPPDTGSVTIDLQKLYDTQQDNVEHISGYEEDTSRKGSRKGGINMQRSVDSALSNVESESHVSATDGSTASVSGRSRSRRSALRRQRSSRDESDGAYGLPSANQGIVSRMLAPRDSLLNMCLLKGMYNKAEQVIKIFGLEGQSGAAEVTFAEQYGQSVKSLHMEYRTKLAAKLPRLRARPGAKMAALKSSVASAAAVGVESVSSTSPVDQVLGMVTMSGFAASLFQSPKDTASPLKTHICPAHLPAMVVLDLACVGARTWDSSLNLIEMAQGRLQQATNQEVPVTVAMNDKKNGMTGIGVQVFLNEVQQLLKLGSLPEAEKEELQMYYKRSLQAILSTGTIPFHSAELKELSKVVNEVNREVKRVQASLVEKSLASPHSRTQSLENLAGSRSSSAERLDKGSAEAMLKAKQRPVVRSAMKRLLMAVAAVVPRHGMAAKLIGSLKPGEICKSLFKHLAMKTAAAELAAAGYIVNGEVSGPGGQYLKSLYEHVKSLACLVEECRGNKNHTYIDYFHMLHESPTHILGKLIFLNQMPPKRLEGMAHKLHIDLTQIIVNGCCPSIPALTLPSVEKGSVPEIGGRLVLNEGGVWAKEPRHPELVVRELLTQLITVMEGFTSDDDIFSTDYAYKLVSEGHHFEVANATQELKFVDLTLLNGPAEKLSFYSNLANLMTLHIIFSVLEEGLSEQEGSDCGHPIQQVMSQRSTSGLDPDNLLPQTDLEWLVLHNKMAYHVGQLGILSLFELRQFVIRAELPPAVCSEGLLQARYHGIDNLDPWSIYGPPRESRLLFVQTEGKLSSPPLQVMEPETAVEQVQASMVSYLAACVSVDTECCEVHLPELVVRHSADFASEIEGGRPHEGLLNFIHGHVQGTLQNDIGQILEAYQQAGDKDPTEVVTVIVDPKSTKFGFTFDFNQFQSCLDICYLEDKEGISNPTYQRRLSQMWQTSRPENAMFHLTPLTLDYLSEKHPLVSTLASCVSDISGQRGELENLVEDDTSSHMDDRNACDTLKDYRYTKLNCDYPALARFVAHQTLPLEAARNNSVMMTSVEALMQLNLDENIRISLLSSPKSQHYSSMVQSVLYKLVTNKRWEDALQLLDAIPSVTLSRSSNLCLMRDFLLCCAAWSHEPAGDEESKWQYLLEVQNPCVKARAVLGNLTRWSVETAIQLLTTCQADDLECSELQTAVQTRLLEMKTYRQITDCALSLKQKQSALPITQQAGEEEGITMAAGLKLDQLECLTHWQTVVQQSSEDPGSVLELLLDCHEYQTARDWAQIHNLDDGLRELIEESSVCHFLEKDHPDYSAAYQALEQQCTANRGVCLNICNGLLERLANKQNSLFVLQFMLTHLRTELTASRINQLQLQGMGCKALLCLPVSARESYDSLVKSPALLAEQLLMNMQVEWLGHVIKTLEADLEDPDGENMGFDTQTVNELLVKYATKALEFPVIQSSEQSEYNMSRSQSRMSLASVAMGMTGSTSTSQVINVGGRRLSTQPNNVRGNTSPVAPRKSRMKRSESAATIQPMRTGPVSRKSSVVDPPVVSLLVVPTSSQLPQPAGQAGRQTLATSPQKETSEGLPKNLKHTMPPKPPSRDEWIPDSAVKECMVCHKERFSMFVRRHHCRRCGWVVCGDCSTRTTMVCGVSARTCDLCYQQIFKPRAQEEQARQHMFQRLSGVSPINTPPPLGSASPLAEGDFVGNMEGGVGLCIDNMYQLSMDEDENEALREEFYFEQAPSTSLCLSMLELHSDKRECGQLILKLCDDVSRVLKQVAPGVRNPEIDYGLVISILKHLLFNAKVKFLMVGDSSGGGDCDIYLDRIDLLNLLVTANCTYLPSMQQLTKMDSLRRLRDRLIEEERLDLAMEVSMKCGIDPAGVWVTMGKAALAAGDYEAAREKFQHCLRVPVDRNLATQAKLLSEILEFLENSAPPMGNKSESLLAPLRSNQDLLAEPRMKPHEEGSGYDLQLKECLYYLEKYGSHVARVAFFHKHGYLNKATYFILDKRCSPETFIEGLLVPCMQTGQMGRLQDQMLAMDPSLERWAPYLNAVCKHLVKARSLNSLYQWQIFMKDYFRAAMTCIKHFYQEGAVTYADLFTRIQHLLSAKQHLESYLDQQQWEAVGIRGNRGGQSAAGADSSFRMIRSPTEVNRYINTISLQIEVTKFLHLYMENLEAVMSSTNTSGPRSPTSPSGTDLPTLFGSTRKKTDVVNLVLLSGNNVNDGFGLAFRIIQDFKLDYTSIYVEAGQHFSLQRKFSAIRQLLSCIRDSGLCSEQAYDEVIINSIRIIHDSAVETKEVEALIKLIRLEPNMISAYISCGKLRSAYLIAVKSERIEDVKRISAVADSTGQTATKKICDKWLQQKGYLP